jgi:hypothetical protein
MSAATEIPIIDIDSHFTEKADLWQSRAPSRFKAGAPRLIDVSSDPIAARSWASSRSPTWTR